MTSHAVFSWMADQIPAAIPAAPGATVGRSVVLSKETYEQMALMLSQGMAQGAIARKLGVKHYHVNNLKRRLAAGKGLP